VIINLCSILVTVKISLSAFGGWRTDSKACYLLSLRFDLSPLLLCIINSLSMKTNLQRDAQGRDFPAICLPFGHRPFNSIASAISASP